MHENTRKALDALEGAIDVLEGAIEDEISDLDEASDLREEVEELKINKETLDKARELTTEIVRRLSLGLDPGPTEADFRELLGLLEDS